MRARSYQGEPNEEGEPMRMNANMKDKLLKAIKALEIAADTAPTNSLLKQQLYGLLEELDDIAYEQAKQAIV